MVIYFGLIGIVALAMFYRPSIAVGALLCTYGLEQWSQSQSPFFFSHQILTNVVTASLVCFAIVLRTLKGKSPVFPITREYVATFAIYLLAFMSIAWSIDRHESWERFGEYFKTGFIFALLMPLALSDKEDLRATLYCVLTLGTPICMLLLFTAHWNGRMIMFDVEGISHVKGLERGNPLAIATLGGEVALIAWLMNFTGKARIWQVMRFAIVGIGFAVSVKASSRGQAFGFIIAAMVFLPYSRRFQSVGNFLAVAAGALIGAGVLVFVFDWVLSTASANAPTSRWDPHEFIRDFKESRIDVSMVLIRRWLDGGPLRWVFGLGSSASFATDLKFYCHVVFVEVFCELGVMGWILLWLTPIYAYQNMKELWYYVKDDPEDRGMVASLGAIFLFEVIISFKQGSLLGSATCFGLACVIGRIAHYYRTQAAYYTQLDAGGYALSDEDMEYPLDDVDEQQSLPARV